MVFAGGGKTVPHFFCGTWLNSSGYCLKVFCLASCPIPSPLPRKSRLQLSQFFVCACWFSQIAHFSTMKSGICEAKLVKGIHHQVIHWVPWSLVSLPSFLIFQSLFMFVFYIVSRIFSYTYQQKEQGKGPQLHFFLKPKFNNFNLISLKIVDDIFAHCFDKGQIPINLVQPNVPSMIRYTCASMFPMRNRFSIYHHKGYYLGTLKESK